MTLNRKHEGFIGQRSIRSPADYIVHNDEKGVVAECVSLDTAKQALEKEQANCKAWAVEPHFAIFRWTDAGWKSAISLYALEEAELEKNPTSVVRFP